jgi:hypothetical protein
MKPSSASTAGVKDWVSGFLLRHMRRFPGDWPREPSDLAELRRLWQAALERQDVEEGEADSASRRLAESPPAFRRDHIPALLAAVKAIRAERGAGAAESREDAKAASQHCPRCSGEGITVVWHPRPDPLGGIAPCVAAYCVCRHGRWIVRNHRTGREGALPFIDLKDVLDGRSGWLAAPADLKSPSEKSHEQRTTIIPGDGSGRRGDRGRAAPHPGL